VAHGGQEDRLGHGRCHRSVAGVGQLLVGVAHGGDGVVGPPALVQDGRHQSAQHHGDEEEAQVPEDEQSPEPVGVGEGDVGGHTDNTPKALCGTGW
jgi:hypothetical protein